MDDYELLQNRLETAYERNRLRKYPELHYLFFELTDQCNLHCLHCGSNCGARGSSFLVSEKVLEIIRNVSVKEPRVHIVLTGGEPLLHPDFSLIIEELHHAHLYWSVVTNAMLITDDMARTMKECHIYSASVSIDGTAEDHNLLRQNPAAYDLAVRGIYNLKKYDIPVQVTSVITKRTLPKLEQIHSVISKMNVFSWKVLNIEPIGRAEDNRDLLLSRDELFQLFDFIRKYRETPDENDNGMEITYGCSHFLPFPYEGTVRDAPFLCGAGIMIASVQCSGDIAACLDIERRQELVQGNIYKDDFFEVWQNRYRIFRRERTEESELCNECRYALLCGGDSFHTWDFDLKRPRLCLLTQ